MRYPLSGFFYSCANSFMSCLASSQRRHKRNCVPREVALNCLLMKSFINKNVFLCVAVLFADGHANVEVQLITKKYAEKGSSVSFFCNHNVDLDILYKVMATSSLYYRPLWTFWLKFCGDFSEAWWWLHNFNMHCFRTKIRSENCALMRLYGM